MKTRVAIFTLALAGTFAGLAEKPFLAFNEDDTHYYGRPENVNREGFRRYIANVCRGHVTHFFLCANAQCAIFDSKTIDPAWKRSKDNPRGYAANLKRLVDSGLDPIQLWLECCREKGVSFWVSMRMNDIHDAGDIDNVYHSSFWREHPEYWRMAASDYNRNRAFNYAVPEVRAYHLAFIKELIDRYDADGFELDWLRFPNHLPGGKETRLSHLLTDFVRQVRVHADAAAKKRGHPVKIGVRVSSSPEGAAGYGENVVDWARQGLVDLIVPCNYYSTANFDTPIARWMRMIREVNPDVLVIPGTDSGVVMDNLTRRRMMNTAEYCGWAESIWAEGAKGLYLFNLYENPPDSETWNTVLSTGLNPEYVASARRLVPKSYCDAAGGFDNGRRLPASLKRGAFLQLRIGHPPKKGTAGVYVAFDSEKIPDGFLKGITLNGVANTGVEPVPATGWVGGIIANATSMASAQQYLSPSVKSSFRCAFPLSALVSGQNEVGFMRHETLKVVCCELEIDPNG